MYLGFFDEADHTAKNKFTVCGLTAIHVDSAVELSRRIEKVRIDIGKLKSTDLLKFSSNSKPDNCSEEDHRLMKSAVVNVSAEIGAVFFGYCHFNEDHVANDADRNRMFGFNTLISNFNDFLVHTSSFGTIQMDRCDFSRNTKKEYRDAYEFMREKFQLGNKYADKFKPLNNIFSYSMSCEGTSHLNSLNDILTGSLRYLANGDSAAVRKAIQAQLQGLMWKDEQGRFKEHGFTLRPYDQSQLKLTIRAEYEALRLFLNS